MDKKLCIVHANCQGPPLIERLMICPQFAEQYECTLFTNYTREPVPDSVFSQGSLFLYQYLGPEWGDLASDTLLKKLSGPAVTLCIPNMFFKGYWPLWSGEPGFDYRCTHLDEVIRMGLSPEETVALFLHSDVARKYDLLDLCNRSIAQEREREKRTPIKYLDVIIEKYRETRLFNTVNHPGALLMNHVAQGVLARLGFEVPAPGELEALSDPFPEFEQPINPKIAQYFGWTFAAPETEYEIYGRKMNYARYIANYVVAQQMGIEDFIGYLQGAYVTI